MTETPSSPDQSSGRLAAIVQPIAAVARRMKTGVGVLAAGSAGAALFVWAVLWWPPSPRLVSLLGAGATLVGLLLPAGVLGLCYQGLNDLLNLPQRVSDRTARTVKESTEAVRTVTTQEASGVLARLWRLLKRIWTLRSMLSENRALLLRYGAVVRFVTPGFLLVVAIAAVAGVLLIFVACTVGLLALMGPGIPGGS